VKALGSNTGALGEIRYSHRANQSSVANSTRPPMPEEATSVRSDQNSVMVLVEGEGTDDVSEASPPLKYDQKLQSCVLEKNGTIDRVAVEHVKSCLSSV
jgi:hypothetical protein